MADPKAASSRGISCSRCCKQLDDHEPFVHLSDLALMLHPSCAEEMAVELVREAQAITSTADARPSMTEAPKMDADAKGAPEPDLSFCYSCKRTFGEDDLCLRYPQLPIALHGECAVGVGLEFIGGSRLIALTTNPTMRPMAMAVLRRLLNAEEFSATTDPPEIP